MNSKFLKLIALLFTLALHLPANQQNALPKSWYELPEDSPLTYPNSIDWETPGPTATENVDRILRTHANALESLAERFPNEEKRKWYFAACMVDLSISLQGLLGVLVAKGEAAAQLYWRPLNKPLAETVGDEVDLVIRNESRNEIAMMIEPLVKAIMATGNVEKHRESELLENLSNTIMSNQEIMQSLIYNPGNEWYVSRLRLDFTVDASGAVKPGTQVGGGVRLRFEWEPSKPKTLSASSAKTIYSDNLKRFVQTVGRQLEAVPFHDLGIQGFALKSLKLGIGIFAEGNIGIVKAAGSVMGHLYFSRRAQSTIATSVPLPSLEFIPLIDKNPSAANRAFAQSIGVRHERLVATMNSDDVYYIPVERFRKGLEKAVKIGTFLAERSNRLLRRRLELYQIKTEFALSLSGSVMLVKIGGTAALELAFQRT